MIEFQNISTVYQGKNGEVQALEHVTAWSILRKALCW